MKKTALITCIECESLYYADSSKMSELCPECAHVIYGYEPCLHEFEEGKCIKCFFDGSKSDFIKKLSN